MVASPDVLTAYREWADAREGYELAAQFAKAQVDEDFANPRVLQLFRKSKITTIEGFAYSAVPVRVISSRLRVLAPSVTRIGSDEPALEATKALDEICARNELLSELKSMFRHVSRDGDAYLFVWPVVEREQAEPDDEDDDPDGPPPATRVVGVDVLVNEASGVRAIYHDHNHLKIKFVVRTWVEKDTEDVRLTLYYPDHVEKWYCPKGKKVTDPDSWDRHPDAPNDIPTPLGRLPWFHIRNDRPYGVPEHMGAYGPQRLINKLVSSLAAVVDYQVAPQRYYMADPSIDDPHQNLTSPDLPEDEDDDPESGGESPLSADPAAVWKLYGRSAGQFDPPDPENLLKPFERAVQAMAELTGIPKFHFGIGTGDTPSGAALRTLDAPTGEIVDDRKDDYGTQIQRALEDALALLGHTGVRVHLPWRPTTIITDLEGWQIVATKIAAGVPAKQALVEAGYLPEQVSEWIQDAAGSDLPRRLALLQAVAAIVQGMGGSSAGAGSLPTPPSSAPPAPQSPEVAAAVNQLLAKIIDDIAAGMTTEDGGPRG